MSRTLSSKGKQATVSEFLLNDIRQGLLQPGDRLYSRSVFMEKFGCARGTVDQAVQKLIRAGYLTSEKGKGTFVALRERGAGSGHVALVAKKGQAVDIVGALLNGMMTALGNEVKTVFYTFEALRHPTTWQECRTHSVLVFLLPDAEHESFLSETRLQSIPHLVVYRDPPESPFISIDNIANAAKLVDVLAKNGKRRIAFAAWKQSRYHFSEQIYTGFLEGLLRNQLPRLEPLVGTCAIQKEEPLLDRIFGASVVPDALLFYGVPMGKILSALQKRGLEAGRDVTLCNYNYVKPGDYPFPLLSPVPIEEELGREAAAMIKQLRQEGTAFEQRLLVCDVRFS